MKRKTVSLWYNLLIFFALPFLGYTVFAYFAAYYAGDTLHEGVQLVFQYAAIIVDGLFPYLYIGLTVAAVARYGYEGQWRLIILTVPAALMPMVCDLLKTLAVNPAIRRHFGDYLPYALRNSGIQLLVSGTMILALLICAGILHFRCLRRNPVTVAVIVSCCLILAVNLANVTADTVESLYRIFYAYYDTPTAREILSMVLSYLRVLVFAAAGSLLAQLQAQKAVDKKPKATNEPVQNA